jgi:uncharacterized protein YggE
MLGGVVLGLVGGTARAEESAGITVSETGVAAAMPDIVELTATVEGNAELAGDAVEKYRGNKRRVLDALNKLNIKGSTVAGAGLAVNSGTPVNFMAALQAGQANQPKAADKVAFQERLTVTLAGIDTMNADDLLHAITRIVDAIKDAGVPIGTGPKSLMEMQLGGGKSAALATFRLSNPEVPRQQAYESALKQARATAERLAKLAGVELGEIVSIRETAAAAKDGEPGGGGMAALLGLMGGASGDRTEYTSAEFQNIPVTVRLSVQFAIKGR